MNRRCPCEVIIRRQRPPRWLAIVCILIGCSAGEETTPSTTAVEESAEVETPPSSSAPHGGPATQTDSELGACSRADEAADVEPVEAVEQVEAVEPAVEAVEPAVEAPEVVEAPEATQTRTPAEPDRGNASHTRRRRLTPQAGAIIATPPPQDRPASHGADEWAGMPIAMRFDVRGSTPAQEPLARRAVAIRVTALRHCYEWALQEAPQPQREIRLVFRLDADGSLRAVSTNAADDRLDRCLVSQLRRRLYPTETPQTGQFTVTLRFWPRPRPRRPRAE